MYTTPQRVHRDTFHTLRSCQLRAAYCHTRVLVLSQLYSHVPPHPGRLHDLDVRRSSMKTTAQPAVAYCTRIRWADSGRVTEYIRVFVLTA